MKITNQSVPNTTSPVPPPVDETAAAAAAGADPSIRIPMAAGAGYTPSAELAQLMEILRQQPEVRDDRFQAAAARLRQGDYHTAAAAAQTAAALLNERG